MNKTRNTWTIMSKEFARFFGDRSLVFSVVLLPGLLIYFVYSFIGTGMEEKMTAGADTPGIVYVEQLPEEMRALVLPQDYTLQELATPQEADAVRLTLADNKTGDILVRFPENFMADMEAYVPSDSVPAPNIQIFYNSNSIASQTAYYNVMSMLESYEMNICNRFDINAATDDVEVVYDSGDNNAMVGDIFGSLLPMLIMMMLFSGCMSIAPSSIAGEKERGTIATLLVTPMRRNQLAWGKILSLSVLSLLSGISSFVGIMLSLPKMIHGDDLDLLKESLYSTGDYLQLFVCIISAVLLLISVVSIISAFANSVKSAQTMMLPVMILVMAISFSPMLGSVAESYGFYLLPFYNNVQCMARVFMHEGALLPLLITTASNLLYTALAITLLTKMFNSERIMFGK